MAGGSSPTPGPNWIIGALPGQLFVYRSVGVLGGGLVKTVKLVPFHLHLGSVTHVNK